MSLDVESRTRPLPEVDVEQEVDFGRYGRMIAARWWLIVLGGILGASIGLVVSVGSSRPYEASTIVYLGQPYFPGQSGQPIQNLSTKFSFSRELVVSRASLAAVAAKTGIRPGILKERVAVKFSGAPLVSVIVDRLPAAKAAAAADAFSDILVRYFSTYVDLKLATYAKRFSRTNAELAQVNENINSALAQQKELVANHTLPPTEKLLLLANINNVLQYNTTRQNNLESALITHDDTVALAQQVEKAKVLEKAQVKRSPAPSRRTSVLIGGFIGVIVGLIAALLWEPVVRRVRSHREATSSA